MSVGADPEDRRISMQFGTVNRKLGFFEARISIIDCLGDE